MDIKKLGHIKPRPILTSVLLNLKDKKEHVSKYGTCFNIPRSRNENYFSSFLTEINKIVRLDKIVDCRVIVLPAGHTIKEHTDKTKHYKDCLHLVLKTNDKCRNKWGNEELHMELNNLYWVDQSAIHKAENLGQSERAHLVIMGDFTIL